ncbi:hypothetical protein BaRGS_00001626 [Batillaria attramentaria]|uniref:Uncharacterized protein n=1 Tax=Batillaria attramentaria TaxID=370345 RepID=A0ABD0M8J3_9CAEN
MPGVPVMSQESWKQVRFDVMTGKRRKKSRHKMSTISKLCSCMAGQTDDFPESSRPFERKYLASSCPPTPTPSQIQSVTSSTRHKQEITTPEITRLTVLQLTSSGRCISLRVAVDTTLGTEIGHALARL